MADLIHHPGYSPRSLWREPASYFCHRPKETKEVFEGEMCGMSFTSTARVDLQEGDRIELFSIETVERHL